MIKIQPKKNRPQLGRVFKVYFPELRGWVFCFGLNYCASKFCQTTEITGGCESATLKIKSPCANFANRPQFYKKNLFMYLPIYETL